MRNLDFYEFAGIVVPGAVTLFLALAPLFRGSGQQR